MSSPLQQFVVDTLVPENRQGGGTYALSEASVSPTRWTRGEDGVVREETVCTLAKSAKFVDPDGNICDVALRTGRVLSQEMEAVRYEMVAVADQIRGGGLPLDECPHTFKFAHFKGGPLVPNPEGVVDCGGYPGGCSHMRAVIIDRRAGSRARWESEQAKSMTKEAASEIFQAFADTFGEMLSNAQASQAKGKQKLRGTGEEG